MYLFTPSFTLTWTLDYSFINKFCFITLILMFVIISVLAGMGPLRRLVYHFDMSLAFFDILLTNLLAQKVTQAYRLQSVLNLELPFLQGTLVPFSRV